MHLYSSIFFSQSYMINICTDIIIILGSFCDQNWYIYQFYWQKLTLTFFFLILLNNFLLQNMIRVSIYILQIFYFQISDFIFYWAFVYWLPNETGTCDFRFSNCMSCYLYGRKLNVVTAFFKEPLFYLLYFHVIKLHFICILYG